MKLKEILFATSLLISPTLAYTSEITKPMPIIKNYSEIQSKNILCKGQKVKLDFYEYVGVGVGLTATRQGQKKPYATMLKDEIVYLDKNEDGIIDDLFYTRYAPSRGICEDIPKDIHK